MSKCGWLWSCENSPWMYLAYWGTRRDIIAILNVDLVGHYIDVLIAILKLSASKNKIGMKLGKTEL